LLGSGPGRFLAATGKYATLKLTNAEGLDSQFTDAHNFLIEYAVTTGVIGLAVLVAFLAVAFGLSGWGSPLAGFAILALAMQLVEPQHGFVTPVVFLALGAAATGPTALSWRSATAVQVLLIAVACEQALVIALGSRTVAELNGPILSGRIQSSQVAAAYKRLDSAVWETPFWASPVSLQDDLDELRAQGAPGATQDAVQHARQAAEREPERVVYWGQLAFDEEQASDVGAARAAFQRALAVDPWAADVQVQYARFLIDQGDTEEAKRQLQHAVLALPDRTEADQLLSQLG
jgi:tetratricopeptide (TPR) repeat protein